MTTVETQTVVTVLFHHVFRYARNADEIAELVREVVDEPQLEAIEVYSWDRPCQSSPDGTVNEFPSHKLRVFTDPDAGWGAVSYHNEAPGEHELADTFNPALPADAPALPFDPEGQLYFPASASLPLDAVREIVEEYCRTGWRPECVRWQVGQWI